MATQDEYIKTALRLPRALHASVQAAAENAGRSMNAEIISRLESSLSDGHPIHMTEDAFSALNQTIQGLATEINVLKQHLAKK